MQLSHDSWLFYYFLAFYGAAGWVDKKTLGDTVLSLASDNVLDSPSLSLSCRISDRSWFKFNSKANCVCLTTDVAGITPILGCNDLR